MKNLKTTVVNTILILVGVLGFVFMTQQIYGGSFAPNGYDFFDLELNEFVPTELALIKVSVIINIIVLSLMMLVAIVNLLVNFGVIKNVKVAKILNLCNLVLAALFLVFTVCVMASALSFISGSGVGIGWAVVVNVVLAVVALVAAIVAIVKGKK